MTLRHQGKAVDPESLGDVLADPTGRVVVFVHGLSCTEWQWGIYSERFYERRGVTFGKRLAEDLGFTPLFLRYNTGRHISENGQDLSALLDRIVEQYPVPIEEIALVGHSMGGLVSRSAAHYGKAHDANWITSLKHLFCIGSPHLGAPLEKATNALTSLLSQFDVAGTQVPAELLNARSAGIKDLRYGYIVDDEWLDRDPDAFWEDHRQEIPLVDHVSYYAIGSSLGGTPDHPVSQLLGDMMVRLPSAHGEHPEEHRRLHFHMKQYFPRVQHLTLMNHPDVYEQLKTWLAGTAPQLDGGPA